MEMTTYQIDWPYEGGIATTERAVLGRNQKESPLETEQEESNLSLHWMTDRYEP